MQRGSAARDDVNGTAFANEKLSWHVLKDKAPTLGCFSICLFTMLLPEMVFDQEMTLGAACGVLMLSNSLHFINYVNCVFGIAPGYWESFLEPILLTIRSEHVTETD